MGDGKDGLLRVDFDARMRFEFVGSNITSDGGLLAYRQLHGKLGFTVMASEFLAEQRSGHNVRHRLIPLPRKSVYSRLAGYPDTNDAGRLSPDTALRLVLQMAEVAVTRDWFAQILSRIRHLKPVPT